MDLKKLISDYLKTARVMQLATSVDNQPWVSTVHFYSDDDLNFYWISTPERRHSQEIDQNQRAAIAIKIHEDTPDEKYIIGISAEGTAEIMNNDEVKKIGEQFINKLDKDPNLVDDMIQGKKPFKFYRFKPSSFVLFDTKNSPDQPRQELEL